MMHDEAQAVLAAYALDAVEPPEREELETHLEGCPRCRSELSGYQEVTGMLAGGGAEVPAGLWDRIASQLGEAPPPLRLVPDGGASRSRWPRRAVRRLGAAALV
ncbi:MAG: zf-HC2 domain-containing protein, partial [Acidimicrobiales bacterium]